MEPDADAAASLDAEIDGRKRPHALGMRRTAAGRARSRCQRVPGFHGRDSFSVKPAFRPAASVPSLGRSRYR